ncbi:MAG: TVP38/TMEM64 family protein [Anaerovoracaceae bacterium]
MDRSKRKRYIIEVLLGICAAVIVIYIVQRHAPPILKIIESGNITGIRDYLNAYGTDGKYLIVVLQIIETVSIVLPAAPVYICAGVMFGKVPGILICYGTNIGINILMFLFSRHTGKSFSLPWIRKKDSLFTKFLQSSKHIGRVVFIMSLLPIVPGGTIPLLSAKTDITLLNFTKALAAGCLPQLIIYVCCGDILVSDGYRIIIPIIIVLVALGGLCFLFRKQLTTYFKPKLEKFLSE